MRHRSPHLVAFTSFWRMAHFLKLPAWRYRIATWSIDPKQPFVLRAFEDKQLAFTAVITQVTQDTLRLRQNLPRSNESRMLTLKAIEEELVCPDLRR